MAACVGDCFELGPPPDTILSLPPPPLPSFLLPRSAILSVSGNNSQPCFAAFVCEPSLSVLGTGGGSIRDQSGIEFIELSHKGIEDTWVFILVSSCVGVLLLGALLAFILIKCRDVTFGSFHPHSDASMMKPPMPIIGSNLLYPNCSSGSTLMMGGGRHQGGSGSLHNNSTNNNSMAIDNRMLWATLTPHGTRHHIVPTADNTTPYYAAGNVANEDHYEVVDYYRHENKMNAQNSLARNGNSIGVGGGGNYLRNVAPIKVKSFENSGFVDFDYADPTPLMNDTDSTTGAKDDEEDNVDLDSGYQEPQEILSSRLTSSSSANNSPGAVPHYNPHNGQYTMEPAVGTRRKHRNHHHNYHGGSRPVVSSPTRIENPNVLPPLNLFPGGTTMPGRYQATTTTATIGGRGKNKYVTVGTTGNGGNAANNGSMTASLNRRINEFTASRKCANI